MSRREELQSSSRSWRLPWAIAGLILVLGTLASIKIGLLDTESVCDESRSKAIQDLATVRARLEGVTATVFSATAGLGDIISHQGTITPELFDALAERAITAHPQIRNIAIAPDDIIRQVYPLKGNERVIGLRYATIPEQYRAVQQARISGHALLSGPHRLVQGGEALILRTPVFTRQGVPAGRAPRYWGVVSIVTDVDAIIDAGGLRSVDWLEIALRREDQPHGNFGRIWGDPSIFTHQPVSMTVIVPGGTWRLAAVRKGGWPSANAIRSPAFYVGLANTLLLTALAWVLTTRHLLLRKRNRELRQEIMERTRAEEELRLSEQKYASIFQLMPDMVVITRMADGCIIEVNTGFEQWSGWTPEEVIGRTSLELGIWDQETRARALATLMEKGRLEHSEFVLHTKSGEERNALMYLTPIIVGGEQCLYFMARDITELKRAQSSLVREQVRLRSLLQTIPALVWMKDPDGVYLGCNRRFERFFGAREAEIVGRTDYDFVAAEQADFFQANDQKAIAADGPSINEEWITYADDGHRELLETIKTPVRDGDGKVIGVLGIARDITEHRRIEDALRAEQQRFQNLVDSIDGIVWEADAGTFTFTYVSQQAERLLGYPVEAWYQPGFWQEQLHPDDREWVSSKCADHTLRGEDHDFDYRFMARDGRTVWLHDIVSVVKEDGSPRWLRGIMVDMTAMKAAEAEKRKLEAQLLHSQKMEAIGRLAGGVAHDFNNKLTVILGYAEIARTQGADGERLSHYLGQIINAAGQSRDLTQQLLAFSRQELISPRTLDLNHKILDVRQGMGRFIGEDIRFEVTLAPDLWPVCIDPSQVDQLIMNLVVNARDAMTEGGVLSVETGNVRVDEMQTALNPDAVAGEYVLLMVSDTGCGMDRETMEHIFEPFFTTKEAGRGTGLGLATLYGIVTQNKGFVDVYSEPGVGSCFRIYLPRSEETCAPPAAVAAEAPAARPASILLVEDDESVRELTGELLEQAGYTTIVTASPEEALERCTPDRHPLDLLITDVIMPGMNGRELAQQIAARYPAIKTLFMSGYTADIINRKGVLDSDIHFIQKPFDLNTLLSRISDILNPAAD